MLGASVGTCEQRVLPVERDRADGPLDGVVVEFDTAVIECLALVADTSMATRRCCERLLGRQPTLAAGRALIATPLQFGV
jgi:hypothetical protein